MTGYRTKVSGGRAVLLATACITLSGCANTSGKATATPARTTPAEAGLDAQRLEAEATAIRTDIQAGVLPGAVLVVGRNGRIAWERTLGTQGPKDPTPMSLDTFFRIQSMTKPVVSVAIMTLVQQGRIGLDDPVSKYLPEYASTTVYDKGTLRPAKGAITIRHLLTHTSGLIAVVGPPRTPLHEIWQKSGAWTQDNTVLAAVLEVVTGKPFDVVLKEQIFNPLGMKDTDFYLTPQQAAGGGALGGTRILKPEDTGGPHATKVWTWGGSDGTNFWVDPKSGVFIVYMIQNGVEGARLQARFNKAVFESLTR